MKSPGQELFDYVGYQSELMGYDTYDHLPMESENARLSRLVIMILSQCLINRQLEHK